MFVCSCSNPACMANGCQRAASFGDMKSVDVAFVPPKYHFKRAPPPEGVPAEYKPLLTEADVRRIIREEMQALRDELMGGR